MAVYYNENDPFAAQWLRNLIAAGHIADGIVDERSIVDVQANDLEGFTQCHFFAGIGAWSYALRCAGWPDDRPVWTGSCPCQPFSSAGRGEGFDDPRHLWPTWFRLIDKHRPRVIFGEQVASVAGLAWLDLVHADLEGAQYAVGALDLCAAGVGAPHIRQRLYWVADHHHEGQFLETARVHERWAGTGGISPPHRDAKGASGDDVDGRGATGGYWRGADWLFCRDGKWRPVEPGTFPLAHGASARVGRLRAYGNAIVAPLATEFIKGYLA